MNWVDYAAVYDLMAENNPAYQELLARCRSFLTENADGEILRVLEVGAGTGNFSMLAAQVLPAAEVIHLEPDAGMNSRVRTKAQHLSSLKVVEQPVNHAEFQGRAST